MKEGLALVNIVRAELVTEEATPSTYSFETAQEAKVEPAISDGDESILRVKNKIVAMNRTEDIAYGYDIDLSDSVLIPEVLALVDGGELRMELDEVVGYDAPIAGATVARKLFTLNLYTEEKDSDGDTLQYGKLSFKHCKGKPVSWELKDGEFFVPKFKLSSRPKKGERPYSLDFIEALPTV